MLKIFVFNAGHEESLLYEDSVFRTPKKEVREIRLSLWSLMRFVAKDGDLILSGNYILGEIIISDRLGNIVDIKDIPKDVFLVFWALEPSLITYLSKLFNNYGINVCTFPYSDIYKISHRKFSKELSDYIVKRETSVENILIPEWIDNTQKNAFDTFLYNVERIIDVSSIDQIVIKKTYTSSGRGVMFFKINDYVKDSEYIFNRYSNVKEFSIEPYCNIIEDWASEFYIDEKGKCRFVALSNFCQSNGKYIGNKLQSQKYLWDKLSNQIGHRCQLAKIIELQCRFLEFNLKGKYIGFLGIDMFTYRNNLDEICINPFVEINLRMTMGLIAHYIYEDFKDKCDSKIFMVTHNYSDMDLCSDELDLWTDKKYFRVFFK